MDSLVGRLAQLEGSQLVRRAPDDEPAYQFKHALTQDSAYQSLLLKKRRDIHRIVARAYEQLYLERLDEFAALLAAHYIEAGDDSKVVEYAARAGHAAERIYAHTEAVAQYSHALKAASRIDAPRGLVQDLYLRRGRALELQSRFDEAARNYDEMHDAALLRADRELELAALVARAAVSAIPGSARDPEQARQRANQALPLALKLGDRQAESKIYWILLIANIYWGGNNEEAIKNGERSLAIARELNLSEQIAYSEQDLSTAYLYRGDLYKAGQLRLEAADLWRKLENKPMLAENIVGVGVLKYLLGAYDEALANAREGYRISLEIGNLGGQGFSSIAMTLSYIQMGDYGEALSAIDNAVPIVDLGGLEGNGMSIPGLKAWIYAGMGAEAEAGALMREALGRNTSMFSLQRLYLYSMWARMELLGGHTAEAERISREGQVKPDPESLQGLFPPSAHIPILAAAELALAQGDYARALAIMEELLELFERRGTHVDRALALYHKGKALMGLNRQAEARRVWGEARAEAIARRERPALWQILLSLAELERDSGNIGEAKQLYSHAHAVILYLAEHMPAIYRESFLNLEKVKHASQ